MNLRATTLLGLFAAIAVLSACDEPFSPKGSFQDQLVVYSVLIARNDTQFVRVYTTYDPPGFDPLVNTDDHPVTNARVRVSQVGQSVTFRDTSLMRLDTTRYRSPIRAYVGFPFRIQPGKTYTLSVDSSTKGNASATIQVPDSAFIFLTNSYVLSAPLTYSSKNIELWLYLSPVAKGILVRCFVEYEVLSKGNAREQIEVPILLSVTDEGIQPIYPALTRVVLADPRLNRGWYTFPNQAYQYALKQVIGRYGEDQVRFRKARFILTQVEANLYNYYSIVHGFRDPYSIRSDNPDYGNIQGGVGVFGAYTVDSLAVDLPGVITLRP